MKRKETICLAANDVASVFKDFRRALNKAGYNVITYVDQIPKSKIIQQDKYDYWSQKFFPAILNNAAPYKKIRLLNSLYVRLKPFLENWSVDFQFKRILKKTDIFVFFYNTFYEDHKDLELIKKAGKKIVFIFVGDDARWYYGMKQDFELNGLDVYTYGNDYDYSVKGLTVRNNKLRFAEKYADVLFSKREQSQLQLRPFYHYPMVVHLADYSAETKQRKVNPVIVHAPSNPTIKGTGHILAAFDRLKAEGVEFTPVLIQNLPHDEAKRAYQNADIIIDQLFIPGAGKLASEAMAMGKVVVGRMAYEKYDQGFPIADCPIVDAGPDTIYEELKKIIPDYTRRMKLAALGPEYVKKYLDVELFTAKMVRLLNGHDIPKSHLPSFFRLHYKPESEQAREVLNEGLNIIRGEAWYQTYVKSQSSSGEFNF